MYIEMTVFELRQLLRELPLDQNEPDNDDPEDLSDYDEDEITAVEYWNRLVREIRQSFYIVPR